MRLRDLITILIVALGMFACNRSERRDGTIETFVQASPHAITESIDLVANIESASVSAVRAGTGGRIGKIHVKLNQFVAASDVVVTVDNPDVDRAFRESAQRVAIGKANLRKRTAELKQKTTEGDIAIAEAELDVADAELEIARIRFAAQKSMFDQCMVVAPFEGRVIAIDKKEGEPVIGTTGFSLGTQILTLVSKNEYRLETSVGEREIERLRINEPVVVEFPSAPDLGVTGRISAIGATASRSERGPGFPVTILFNSEDERVRLGGTAKLHIVLASKGSCLSVPITCVGTDEKGPWVLAKSQSGIEKRYVQVGLSDGVYAEITAGMVDGENLQVLQ